MNFSQVDRLMRQALEEGVFPGAVTIIFDKEDVRFHEAYGWANRFNRRRMHRDIYFDLASLTKPLATALAVAVLVSRGVVSFDEPIATVLSPFADRIEGRVTPRDLLSHCSGFSAYRPFYLEVNPLQGRGDLRMLRVLLSRERLQYGHRKTGVYSDIGFMLLHWFIEAVSGIPMAALLRDSVFGAIEGCNLFFQDGAERLPSEEYAATEWCPWRCRLLVGRVHDENAWAFGGVGGHAGLFGRAFDVYLLLKCLLEELDGTVVEPIFAQPVLREMVARHPVSGRALGFDMPSIEGSSSGKWFSRESIGHLGFTGTSFWVDLSRRIGVVLLTNRVHPSRSNIGIRRFRPMFHDAVMQCMGIGEGVKIG